jgi:hypothetical protein
MIANINASRLEFIALVIVGLIYSLIDAYNDCRIVDRHLQYYEHRRWGGWGDMMNTSRELGMSSLKTLVVNLKSF